MLKNAKIRGFKLGIYARNCRNLTIEGCDLSDNWKQHLLSTPQAENGADWLFGHENDPNEWFRYGAAVYLETARVSPCETTSPGAARTASAWFARRKALCTTTTARSIAAGDWRSTGPAETGSPTTSSIGASGVILTEFTTVAKIRPEFSCSSNAPITSSPQQRHARRRRLLSVRRLGDPRRDRQGRLQSQSRLPQ